MPPPRTHTEALSLAEVTAELGALSPGDWGRALSIARLRAAGVADLSPDDLLSETVVKLMSGERVWQRGVHALVTLKVAMHSVASNARKKAANAPIDQFLTVASGAGGDDDDGPASVEGIDSRTPDLAADARLQLGRMEELVADDEDASMVLMAWSLGFSGAEAAKQLGFEAKRFDAARQRLLRRLKPVAEARKAI